MEPRFNTPELPGTLAALVQWIRENLSRESQLSPRRDVTRPDALQTIPGRGLGTQPGPETFTLPGENFMQNIAMILNEGLTVGPEQFGLDFGTPDRFWDPKLLGFLAGVTAILEPGPGGEVKSSKGIAGAGIRLKDGRIAIGDPTHMQAMKKLTEVDPEINKYIPDSYNPNTFGFVTAEGNFVTPQQAGKIAEDAGQLHPNTIARRKRPTGEYIDLWSEDLASSYVPLTDEATGRIVSETIDNPALIRRQQLNELTHADQIFFKEPVGELAETKGIPFTIRKMRRAEDGELILDLVGPDGEYVAAYPSMLTTVQTKGGTP
jgi:hypothetical protein